ncbi:hypothetical protein HZS_4047 [Henneguya salminicola]|nr:hypothetical protein HZS_4047 [Henneguya salminicola]
MEVNIKSKNLKLNTETKYLIIVGFVLLFVQSIYAGYSVISVVGNIIFFNIWIRRKLPEFIVVFGGD